MTTEEQILSILNNAIKGGDLPLKITFDGTDYLLIYNSVTSRLEKIISANLATQAELDNYLLLTGGEISGNFSVIGTTDLEGDVYIESGLEVNGDFLGGNSLLTGNSIIGNAGDNNIAGSKLTVNKTSVTGTEVGAFFDLDRDNSASETGTSYASVSRAENISDFDNSEGVVGSNLVARHKGDSNISRVYGADIEADYEGSGNVDFLVANRENANISGSGSGTVGYIRANSSQININNPNITVENAQANHPTVSIESGNVENVHINYLDLDYTGGNVTDELAYIRAGNDTLPVVTSGEAYFIKSEVNLPSEFKNKLKADSFVGDGSELTNLPQPDLSGYATLNTSQEFTAAKTFSSSVFLKNTPINFFQITTTELAQQSSIPKIGFNSLGHLQLLPDLLLASGSAEIDFTSLTAKRTYGISNFNGEIPIQTSKTTVSFLNSWSDFNTGTYGQTSYWKVGNQVFFQGVVTGGALNTAIFAFETGYRPINSVLLYASYFAPPAGIGTDLITINTDGTVVGTSSSTATRLVLSGFFRID